MVRLILGAIAGYVVWTLVFLGGSQGVFAARANYITDGTTTSDIPTLLLFLTTSILASLAAGLTAGAIAGPKALASGIVLCICLLATGIPVQISAWDTLPVWYNLTFLVLLAPVTLVGVRLIAKKATAAPDS